MEINPPEGVKLVVPMRPFALSPDGHKLVFVAAGKDGKRMLWLRSIDSETAAALAGTEGAEIPFCVPIAAGWVFPLMASCRRWKSRAGGTNPK